MKFGKKAVLTAMSTTAGLVLTLANPAAAIVYDKTCNVWKWSPAGTETFMMCTYEDYDHSMYGSIRFVNKTTLSQGVTGTIIVQRCQAGNINCTTITAMSLDMWVYANDEETVTTSKKIGSYGWTYKTCTSGTSTTGWSWTMSCSTSNAYSVF